MLKNIINIVLSTISNILNINANYNKIKSKYNNLFSNAQIIEEWLNKNSLMRHEYKKYVDESFECEWTLRRWGEIDENRWYTMIIPWGKYEAYLPKGEKVTHCSTTNPIVCRNEDYNWAEVSKYYEENGKCPKHMWYYAAWVSWPTAYCAIQWWTCHMSTCDYIEKNWKSNVRSCDLEPRLDCSFNWGGPMFALGDPCDFFLWMWMAPADWSCDHKLKK